MRVVSLRVSVSVSVSVALSWNAVRGQALLSAMRWSAVECSVGERHRAVRRGSSAVALRRQDWTALAAAADLLAAPPVPFRRTFAVECHGLWRQELDTWTNRATSICKVGSRFGDVAAARRRILMSAGRDQ